MIDEFVARWNEKKHIVRRGFEQEHPARYIDIVRAVVRILDDGHGTPDSKNIHEIDDGDYQGTLVYVIPEQGYKPHEYWYVRVWYGSCPGCDVLQGIRDYADESPTKDQADQYMRLALHVVQRMKKMDGETV